MSDLNPEDYRYLMSGLMLAGGVLVIGVFLFLLAWRGL
jgi:hypothetical protein